MTDSVQFPHDHYFKKMMSDPKIIKEFFQQYLPANIRGSINLDTVKHENGSYISDELKQQESDLLFSAEINDKPGYIYTLLEHQSTPDRLLPFRMLRYMVSIIKDHLKKFKTEQLPIVYQLVIYSGWKKYSYSTDLFDLFGNNKELAMDVLWKPFQLIDLSEIPDEKLQQSLLYGVVTRILKHSHEKNAVAFLREVMRDLRIVANTEGIDYIYATLSYIIEAYDLSRSDFAEIIRTELPFVNEEKIMTIAEQFRQEGVQQGIQQGIQKGLEKGLEEGKSEALKNVAMNLFNQGMTTEKIAIATGLSVFELDKLKSKTVN
ncbi:MAG: Rpn family recombination-promoting nuclease/putative transposase [bacterium]